MLLKNPYCKNISQMSNKNICKLHQTSYFRDELVFGLAFVHWESHVYHVLERLNLIGWLVG